MSFFRLVNNYFMKKVIISVILLELFHLTFLKAYVII